MSVQDSMSIKAIFAQAQHSVTAHKKLLNELKSLHDELPNQFFFDAFTECLRVPLMCGEKMAPIERTLDFAVKFVTSFILGKIPQENVNEGSDDEEDEMPKFVTDVFKFMCENAGAENQTVRFRICQFINKLLNGLGNEACMADELCDLLCDRMSERLKDKSPLVRTQAVRALYRLQDPGDPDCRVTSAYIFHFTSDPSPDVRGTALANIAISSLSVPPILERSKDTNETVRKIAFTRLAEMNIQRFSIETRVVLLERGLKDSSEKVRKTATNELLRSWFDLYKGNFVSFLLALDCEHSTEISTLALETMFEGFKTGLPSAIEQIRALQGSDKLIPAEELNAEKVLLWKVLVVYLDKHPEIAEERPVDEPLEDLVPELSTFCTYILKYFDRPLPSDDPYERVQREYILRQLLEMTDTFDLSDEMGRSNLRSTCQTLLLHNGVSDRVIPVLVKIIVKVIPNVDDRLHFLAEIISELNDSTADSDETPPALPPVVQMSAEEKRQLEIKEAKIRMKLNEMTEDQDEAVAAKDFMRAQQLQEECQKLRDELKALTAPPPLVEKQATQEVRSNEELVIKDRGKLQKCLCIVKEMMQDKSVVSLTPTLRSLMHNFVMPCLQQQADDPVVKNMALEAMGLFCVLDIDLAKEHFVYMFCFQIANDEVCETALKITFDLLHLYGLETFEIEENKTDDSMKKRSKKKKNLFVTDTTEDEFEEDDDDTQSQTINSTNANTANLIGMLTSLLNSASTSMRNLAMKGLCKLLLACRMTSSALLSRLMIMWYSPVTDGDEDFRQPLAIFLETLSTICPRGQEMLEQAFLPTVRMIRDAPADSPISEVDLESVTKLFISLTRPGKNRYHKKQNTHVHNAFAITLCNEILNQDDRYADDSVLLKALLQLELCLDDPVFRQDLQKFIVLMKESFQVRRERVMYRYVEKFEKMIEQATPEEPEACGEVDNTAQTEQLNNVDNTLRTVNNTGQSSQLNASAASVVKKSRKNARILKEGESVAYDSDGNASVVSMEYRRSRVNDGIIVPESPPRHDVSSEGSDLDSPVEAGLQHSKRRKVFEDKSKKAKSSDQPISKTKPGTSIETVSAPRSPKKAQPAESSEDTRSEKDDAGAAKDTTGRRTRALRNASSQEETSSGGASQRESRSTRRTAEPAEKNTAAMRQRRESPRKSKDARGFAEPVKRKAPEKRTNQKKDSPVESVDSQESAEDDAEPAKRRAVDKRADRRKESPVKSVDSQESAEPAKNRAVEKRTNRRKESPIKSVDSQESAENKDEPAKKRAVDKRPNQRKESPVKSVDSQESAEDDAEPSKKRAVDKRATRRKESPVKSKDGSRQVRPVDVVVVDINAGRPIREVKLTAKLLAYKEDMSKRSPGANKSPDRNTCPKGPATSQTPSRRVGRATPETPLEKDNSDSSTESSTEPAVRTRATRLSETTKAAPAKGQKTANEPAKQKAAPAKNLKATSRVKEGAATDEKNSSPAPSVRSRRSVPAVVTPPTTPSPVAQRQSNARNEEPKRATRSGNFSHVSYSSSQSSEGSGVTAERASRARSRPDEPAKATATPETAPKKTAKRVALNSSSDEAASPKVFSLRSKAASSQQSTASDSPMPVSSSSGSFNRPNVRAVPTKVVVPPSSSEESSEPEAAVKPTRLGSKAKGLPSKVVIPASSTDESSEPEATVKPTRLGSKVKGSPTRVVIPASSTEESSEPEAAVKPTRSGSKAKGSPTRVVIPASSTEESSEPEVAVRPARSGGKAKDSSATTKLVSSVNNDILERAVERVRSGVLSQGSSPVKNTSSGTPASSEDIIQRAVERVRRSSGFSGESSSASSSTVYRILPMSSSSASPAKSKSSGSSQDKSNKTPKQGTSKESPTRSTERVTSKKTPASSAKKTAAQQSKSSPDSSPSKGSASKSRDKAKSSLCRLSSSSMSSPSVSTRSQDFPNKLRTRKRV